MHNKKRKHIKRSASVLHEGIRKSWNVRGLRKEGQTRHFRYITPRSRDPRAVAGKQNPTTRNRPPSRQASNHIQISPSARHHLHLLVIIHPPKSLPPTSLRSIRPESPPGSPRGAGDGGRGRDGGGEGARPLPGRPPPGGAGALLRGAGGGAGPGPAHRAPQQPRRMLPEAPRLPQGPFGSSAWGFDLTLHRWRLWGGRPLGASKCQLGVKKGSIFSRAGPDWFRDLRMPAL